MVSARRGALLGSAALMALAVVMPGPAQAACSTTAGITTCQGAVTPITVAPGVTTLNISAVTQDIAAATGNAVTFASTGSITISSDLSKPSPPGGVFSLTAANGYAIFAQSTGASSPVSVTSIGDIDGKWGITALGNGAVSVNSTGDVTSTGTRATPEDVWKGGLAAWSENGAVTLTNKGDVTAVFYGLFAFSNTGPNTVSVTSTGDITSSGWDAVFAGSAHGSVEVVSVGGISGKSGGFFVWSSGSTSVTSTGDITAGGTFGIKAYNEKVPGGGSGGNVTVISNGSITSKLDSIQAVARNNGAVEVGSTGDLTSSDGFGIYAMSTDSTSAVSVTSVGDIDGKWGIAAVGNGAVSVSNTGDVISTGALPDPVVKPLHGAILAKSAGGPVTLTNKGNVISNVYGITASSATGDVIVNSTGDVTSSGWDAVFVQSGTGSSEVTSKGNIRARNYGFVVQGHGDQFLSSTGNIVADYYGAFAYSNTGKVTVVSNGDVTAGSVGIIAGNLSTSAVSITISAGTVTGTGGPLFKPANADIPNGSAVFAYGGGNLSVTIGGAATGAAKAGAAGVAFGRKDLNGEANSLIVLSGGLVNNAGGINGLAVLGATGSETVENSGTVTGNVDLGGGANSFMNEAGGHFNMGATVKLGAGNTLSNAGTLSPGGDGVIATTALTGNVTQAADGVMLIDINLATGAGDRINATGTAILDGTVAVTPLGVPMATSSTYTILSAAGGVTDNGLAAEGTVALGLSLRYPNPGDVVLDVTVDFAADGLNPNQTRLAKNLNTLIGDAGGVAPVLDALVGIGDFGDYRDALNQLLPEAYLHAAMAGLYSAEAFSGTLMGCREREGTYAYIAEGQCLWMDAGGGNLSRDKTDDYLGSEQTSWWLGGGGQFAVSDTVHAGVGVRYEHVNQDVGDDANNDGSWGHIGASLKYTPGPWLLGAALSGGKGWIDTERNFGFEGFSGSAKGEQDLSYVHGKLRAAYLFDMGKWYAKPIIDLDATWLSYGDASEDSGGGAGLDVSSETDSVLSATPRLEIGGQMEMANGTLVRPYAQGGVAFYGDTTLNIDSRFLDAPGGTPSFMTETEMDNVLAEISVGLDVLAVENLNVRLSYDGMFGENTQSNAGTLRLEWRL